MSRQELEKQFFAGLGGQIEKEAAKPEPKAEPEETVVSEPPAEVSVPEAPAPEAPPAWASEGRPFSLSRVFTFADTHPAIFDLILVKTFKMEWFSWLSDTLFREIESTFRTSISETNRHKILAVRMLHVGDAAWDHWEIFEKTVNALNGIAPLEGVMQPPGVPLVMAGVDIMNQLRREEFSEEIGRYVAACFLHDHVQYAPPPCDFAQPYLSDPRYRCKDCHQEGSALPPFDGFCPSCTHKFDTEHALSFRPDPERVKKGFGQNIEYWLGLDPAPVRKRFEELDRLPPERVAGAIHDEADDIQAAKLIEAADYRKLKEHQLAEQFGALRGWLEM